MTGKVVVVAEIEATLLWVEGEGENINSFIEDEDGLICIQIVHI